MEWVARIVFGELGPSVVIWRVWVMDRVVGVVGGESVGGHWVGGVGLLGETLGHNFEISYRKSSRAMGVASGAKSLKVGMLLKPVGTPLFRFFRRLNSYATVIIPLQIDTGHFFLFPIRVPKF